MDAQRRSGRRHWETAARPLTYDEDGDGGRISFLLSSGDGSTVEGVSSGLGGWY